MKRFFSLFVGIVLLFSLTSCRLSNEIKSTVSNYFNITDNKINSDDNKKEYNLVSPTVYINNSNYNSVNSTDCYSMLNNYYQRNLYNQMQRNVYYICDTITNDRDYYIKRIVIQDVEIPVQEIRMTFYAFINDNVDVFWLKRSFEYDYRDGDTIIELKSILNSTECAENIDKLRLHINQYLDSIPSDLGEFERELAIHDLIVNNCQYDNNASQISDNWSSFTVVGALVNGMAVCEGYAKSFKLLLNLCGINSRLILGYGNSQPHMWNIVKINDNWYYADITWDDSQQHINHNYLNLNSDKMLIDHTLDEEYPSDLNCITENKSFNFKIPECFSMEYNYNYQMTYVLNEFSQTTDSEIINEICQTILSNQDSYSIIIGDNMDYEDTVNKLLSEEPYKLFYYLIKANEFLEQEYNITIDTSSLSYYKFERLRLITINLNYSEVQ